MCRQNTLPCPEYVEIEFHDDGDLFDLLPINGVPPLYTRTKDAPTVNVYTKNENGQFIPFKPINNFFRFLEKVFIYDDNELSGSTHANTCYNTLDELRCFTIDIYNDDLVLYVFNTPNRPTMDPVIKERISMLNHCRVIYTKATCDWTLVELKACTVNLDV